MYKSRMSKRFYGSIHSRLLPCCFLPGFSLLLILATVEVVGAQQNNFISPALGAASNFSQGFRVINLEYASKHGINDLRDGINWNRIESTKNLYDFDEPRSNFPSRFMEFNIRTSVVLNWGNRLYDNGDTPHTPTAIAAFGRFAGTLVARFPNIDSLEIGNEFNGVNFVKGPLASMKPTERAKAYVLLLKAAAESARVIRPDIRIAGGATHSIAAGYIWSMLDEGAAEYLDTLSIHPYTTPVEQLVRQFAVLRRHPAAAELPIEVTEFGSSDPRDAADHLVKSYCQFSLAGVSRAIWYPLQRRGDGMIPLFDIDGELTEAGKSYQFLASSIQGRSVTDASTNDFTYGCIFGNDVLIIWGDPRDVTVGDEVNVYDSSGNGLVGPFRLSETSPLIFVANENADSKGNVVDFVGIENSAVLADSYHQFQYPIDSEFRANGDSFERFARVNDIDTPLITLPGQERSGTVWNPYRGNTSLLNLRLTAKNISFGSGCNNKSCEIVHRYVSVLSNEVEIKANFTPGRKSEDGIKLNILLNGHRLFSSESVDSIEFETTKILEAGDRLEFIVSPNMSTKGDSVAYKISIREVAD